MIDLTTVNDIVHNGKHVKKIEDSNNRIIWSVRSTPYRKLDYIKFSGNEYVELSRGLWLDKAKYEITFEKYGNDTQAFVGDNSSRDRIFYIVTSYSNLNCNNMILYDKLVDNGKYKLTLTTGSSSSSTSVSGNVYDYQSGTTKSFSRTLDNIYSLGFSSYICARYIDTGVVDYYFKGKLCEYNYSRNSTILTLVPCQRKSDNVCGLYDTTNNVFYPMSGTVITDGARGNVVDENWDVK